MIRSSVWGFGNDPGEQSDEREAPGRKRVKHEVKHVNFDDDMVASDYEEDVMHEMAPAMQGRFAEEEAQKF